MDKVMKKSQIIFLAVVFALLLISAASVHPQLSMDEQDAIVDAVVKTLNPDNMKAQIASQIEADLIEAPEGQVVVLSNWTGEPRDVTVTLDGKKHTVSGLGAGGYVIIRKGN